jgi:hypothetical protein
VADTIYASYANLIYSNNIKLASAGQKHPQFGNKTAIVI